MQFEAMSKAIIISQSLAFYFLQCFLSLTKTYNGLLKICYIIFLSQELNEKAKTLRCVKGG